MIKSKKAQNRIVRKSWGASIDEELIQSLKYLSIDLDTPMYILVEEALRSYIARKSKQFQKPMLSPKGTE